jgi:hypothetical protein
MFLELSTLLSFLLLVAAKSLLRFTLNEPSRLRDNLQPPAIDLDFPVPAITIVLMVGPAPQRVSAPG